jgi:phosphomannomutase
MKKVIAFDLDDTLVVSKAPLTDRMAESLVRILDKFQVCIISGGKFDIFRTNVIERLQATDEQLTRLHLMPTCGTRYYRYDEVKKEWVQRYAEDLSAQEKKRIIEVSEKTTKDLNLWPANPYGEVIEDRDSQISVSLIGQLAPAEKKKEWADKYSDKRSALREKIAEQLPDFEVRSGGMTTIDITRIGIDKAYGMKKLAQELEISKDDILFFGDKLQEGGNDYPVKAMGIDSLEVSRWEDTALALEAILHVV